MHESQTVDAPSEDVTGAPLPRPPLSIEDVSLATWFAATQLSVSPEQTAHFSAPVVYWLAESRFETHFRPMVISRADELIGFLVYGVAVGYRF